MRSRAPQLVSIVALALTFAACNDDPPAHQEPPVKPAVVAPAPSPVVTPLAPPAAPAGSLRADTMEVDFAIYHLSRPKAVPRDLAHALARKAGFHAVDDRQTPTGAEPSLVILTPELKKAPPPPSLDLLAVRARGLSPADQQRLQHPDSVTALLFTAPNDKGLHNYRAALTLARDLARQTDGILVDASNGMVYTPAEIGHLLDDGWTGDIPDVALHVTLDAYRHGDLIRVVSMGMERFGLPDVAVAEVTDHYSDSMAGLVNVVLQTMVERGALDREGDLDLSLAGIQNQAVRTRLTGKQLKGATGVATVHLVRGTDAGDNPHNRVLDLDFPGPAATLQVRHNELLARFFGARDSTTMATHDDELLAASQRAKVALAKLKPRFSPKPPELEQLMVKAPFVARGGRTEWMWVEVVRWEGPRITGILENDPEYVDGLKAGTRVEVDEGSLFDYIYRRRDGKTEGNETGKILTARQR